MPPSIKVDKKTIMQTAFDLIRAYGVDYISARNIAKELNSSTHPIFREYENMDVLKQDLFKHTNRFFEEYILIPSNSNNSFFNVGFRYIKFAKEEKNLFRMMFMSGSMPSDNLIDLFTSDDNIEIMKRIPDFSNYNDEQIKDLFMKIAIFTHGIASLVAANDIEFHDDDISKLLSSTFTALINNIKNGDE